MFQCSVKLYELLTMLSITIYMQLDEMLEKQGKKVDKVLNFAIDDAVLEERITGRWIHPLSGRTYHTKFAPPKVPGVDDVSRCKSFSHNSSVFLINWLYSSSTSNL